MKKAKAKASKKARRPDSLLEAIEINYLTATEDMLKMKDVGARAILSGKLIAYKEIMVMVGGQDYADKTISYILLSIKISSSMKKKKAFEAQKRAARNKNKRRVKADKNQ